MRTAYCYRTGEIGFAKDPAEIPGGTIEFLDNHTARPDLSDEALVDLVTVKARLAHDGTTLLVPGVPEAECDITAVDALTLWVNWAFEPPLAAATGAG